MKNLTIYEGKVRLFIERDSKDAAGHRQFFHTSKGKFNSMLLALFGLRLVSRVVGYETDWVRVYDAARVTGFKIKDLSIFVENLMVGNLEDLMFFYNNKIVAVNGQKGVFMKVRKYAEHDKSMTVEMNHVNKGLFDGYVVKSGTFLHRVKIGDALFDPSYTVDLTGKAVEFTKTELFLMKERKMTPGEVFTARLNYDERGTEIIKTREQCKKAAVALYNYLEAWQGR